eukprot:TRINITY_DN1451_c0_g1_i3.p1 TRINITY_DN1451_c0_g1~~TRINITY_DN1451_c0_g1_i3.p1  ORF type:complete len:130 (+),score=41.05 TRINITY_DN1451_c0_g1_i3:314-703(+)
MSRIYYRSARAAIVCFDLTKKASFSKVKFWVEELQGNEKNCEIYVVGTKVDKIDDDGESRGIELTSIEEYCQTINAPYFETSAKTGHNVDALFAKIAEDYSNKAQDLQPRNAGLVQINSAPLAQQPCSC